MWGLVEFRAASILEHTPVQHTDGPNVDRVTQRHMREVTQKAQPHGGSRVAKASPGETSARGRDALLSLARYPAGCLT